MPWFRSPEHLDDVALSAYVDSETSGRRLDSVRAHVAACEACRARLEELRATKALLAGLPRIESRRSLALGREYALQPAAPPRRSPFVFAPALALTALVLLFAVDQLTPPSSETTVVSDHATAASSEAKASTFDNAGAGRSLQLPPVAATGQPPPAAPAASGVATAPAQASSPPALVPAPPGVTTQTQAQPVAPAPPGVTTQTQALPVAPAPPGVTAQPQAVPVAPAPVAPSLPAATGAAPNDAAGGAGAASGPAAVPAPTFTGPAAVVVTTRAERHVLLHRLEALAALVFFASVLWVYGPRLIARLKGAHR